MAENFKCLHHDDGDDDGFLLKLWKHSIEHIRLIVLSIV